MPWIIHGFNGSLQDANQLVENDCYLSFGHLITNPDSKAFRSLNQINLNHVLFETDESELSIKEIYKQAQSILKINKLELLKIVDSNFIKIFPNESRS